MKCSFKETDNKNNNNNKKKKKGLGFRMSGHSRGDNERKQNTFGNNVGTMSLLDSCAFVGPLPLCRVAESGAAGRANVNRSARRDERAWRASSAPPSGTSSSKRSRYRTGDSKHARSGGSSPHAPSVETMVRATQDNFATNDDLQLFLRVAPRERRKYQPPSQLFAVDSSGRRSGGGGGGGSRRRANNDALVDCYVVPDGEQVVIHPDLR